MTGVVRATATTAHYQRPGPGLGPKPVPHDLVVKPLPPTVAKQVIERNHYLHSLPGGTRLAFGVFNNNRLVGAVTLGVGPFNAHSLVEGARPDDCLTLTRLWLSDDQPRNTESRVLGLVVRALRRHTSLKFLLTYADPTHGHVGTIYQATNWLYTGLSDAMSLYQLGDARPRHSRSLSHAFGTHSVKYFQEHGVDINRVPQQAKHRYIFFLDPTWQQRLWVPVLPYPKKELYS